MDIKVDRINTPEGNLVFTITVSEPEHACFGETEKKIMTHIDICRDELYRTAGLENKVMQDAVVHLHDIKEKAFLRVLNNLKFEIENEFRPRFQPICQEIYNWIYDKQTGDLKKWMQEFDPQRTTYYFDNDVKKQKRIDMPENDLEDDDDDDEDTES